MGIPVEHIVAFSGLGLTVISSAVTLGWFFSTQLSNNRSSFYKGMEKLETKIETKMNDHEDKDESRYVSLGEQIKQLQLRNAAQDARTKKVV